MKQERDTKPEAPERESALLDILDSPFYSSEILPWGLDISSSEFDIQSQEGETNTLLFELTDEGWTCRFVDPSSED